MKPKLIMKSIALCWLAIILMQQNTRALSLHVPTLPLEVLVSMSDIVIIGKIQNSETISSNRIEVLVSIDKTIIGLQNIKQVSVAFCGDLAEFYKDWEKIAPSEILHLFFLKKKSRDYFSVVGIDGFIPMFDNHITYEEKLYTIEEFFKKISNISPSKNNKELNIFQKRLVESNQCF